VAQSTGCIFYNINTNLTGAPFYIDPFAVVYPSEQAWKIHGLTQQAEAWGDPNGVGGSIHTIQHGDAGGGALARATVGCEQTISCFMTVAINIGMCNGAVCQWNTGGGTPAPGWADIRSVLVHEFGHWLGVDHAGDCPNTDGGPLNAQCPAPTSNAYRPSITAIHSFGTDERTIQADDENSLRAARPTPDTNLLANGHVWEQSSWWGGTANLGWKSWNSPSVFRVASGGTGDGGAYINFYKIGGQSSISQDVFIASANYLNTLTMTPRLFFRAPSSGGVHLKVVVRNINNNNAVIYERNCIVPSDATWRSLSYSGCTGNTTFADPPDGSGVGLKFEIYNMTGTNFDIDYARLQFPNF
jgi:hypothetical protein